MLDVYVVTTRYATVPIQTDRLTAVRALSATSDAAGDLTGLSGGGLTESFGYDQAHRLTSATINGTTTTYTTDVNRALPVVLSDGSRTYVSGLGLAYSVDSSNAVQVHHTDGLGSVRALTDGSGNVIQTYQADAFGVPMVIPGTTGTASQPFGFTGQQQDATGLVYLHARYYAPSLGRFMTRDPLAGNTFLPLSLNRSTYVANDPTLAVDPSGQCSSRVCGLGTAILSCPASLSPSSSPGCGDGLRGVHPAVGVVGAQYPISLEDCPENTEEPGVTDESCGSTTEEASGSSSASAGGGGGGQGDYPYWPGPNEGRQTINGRTYSQHTLDRMVPKGLSMNGNELGSRGVPPSVVENALQHGEQAIQEGRDAVKYVYENVVVIYNKVTNVVVTLWTTGR